MPPTPRLPLLRPRRHDGPEPSRGAWISGVCAGLAAHLGISVRVVRLLFFLSLPTVLGPLFYLWLWIFVPRGNPWDATITDVRTSRLATLNATPTASTPTLKLSPAMLWALLLLCLALLAAWIGPDLVSTSLSVTVPLIVLAGVGLIWTGAYGAERELRIGRFLLFALPGALLVLGGVVLWFSDSLTWIDALRGGLLTLIVLSILLLAALPLWARFLRSYKGSLEEQTRQTVRADMAAHLHDSVLQTLALIRARAHDPVEVAKLARAEERHLRSWLYSDREASADSVVTLLKEVAAQVEDLHGVAFDVVSVGDARPGDWSEPLVAATREALTNAAKHAEPPFSLYIEVGEDKAECFVRDHGGGFDLDDVAADRHGVKQSIIERLARHGGRAQIKTRESGTEVQMEVPR